MDAGANIPNARAACGPASELLFPERTLKTSVQIYQGAAVFRNPADSALLMASPAGFPMYEAYGVAEAAVLGNGTLKPDLEWGPHVFDDAGSGDTIPSTLPMGWPLYAKDNRTAALTNGPGTRPLLGWYGGHTGEDTPRPIVWVGFCPFALRELLIAFAKGHADLTAVATTQDFTLYTLPGPARVFCPPAIDSLATDFSGGGTGTATLAIGTDSDPDAIGDEHDIFTGADPGVMTAGVLGYAGCLLAAGTAIKLRVATDTTVAAFSAGAFAGALLLRPGS
jgi:hypothetical protein